MYRTCIYCSADLGSNDALEPFPVGRGIAFDGWRGRLWAVCPKCARWNLAPIEERWEAVEAAERLFTDARLRVQSGNVGLAKLRDGTRLIRVGRALPGELAAWRYGDQLVRRRRHYLIAAGAAAAAGIAVVGGMVALTSAGGVMWGFHSIARALEQRRQRRVIYRVPAAESPTGAELALRRWQAAGSVLRPAEAGGISLTVPDVGRRDPRMDGWGRPRFGGEPVVLGDTHSRAFLGRAMVHLNASGATRRRLQGAVSLLAAAGSAEGFLRQTAAESRPLAKRQDMPGRQLRPEGSLALEMALHEEQERRALEGELALLEAAWREAEEIAAIADRLAGEVPARPGLATG